MQTVSLAIALAFLCTSQARAGGVTYENEKGQYVKVGGRIQVQYDVEDPDWGGGALMSFCSGASGPS